MKDVFLVNMGEVAYGTVQGRTVNTKAVETSDDEPTPQSRADEAGVLLPFLETWATEVDGEVLSRTRMTATPETSDDVGGEVTGTIV